MTHPRIAACLLAAAVAWGTLARAQSVAVVNETPSVNVTATAASDVANDRVHAWLRAEAQASEAAAAAKAVNAMTARALARSKATPSITVATSGYNTQTLNEKGRPTRWRVTQTLTLEGADFEAIAALVTRLQAEEGLLLSGLSFSVSRPARERAERDLMQEALRAWQARAATAASALGYAGWRPGHVTVQTGEPPRPYPMARMAVESKAADFAPVAIEGGFTSITVTVTGEAWLDQARPTTR